MMTIMVRMVTAKLTASGQISVPAAVRRRWAASRVVVTDLGDRIEVRPLPEDPIGAACGSLRRGGAVAERVRARERQAEREHQDRRAGGRQRLAR
jgi:bifunctional DNA-binding transcriptional regulator/antitoxin component of YhaV-PrlF toxin-antitoxin module